MPKSRFDAAVTALLDEHHHPLREAIDALRATVLAADPSIIEGVKWNTASFRTEDWFATVNGPKQTKEPMLVLHAGAKAKGTSLRGAVKDPDGMLRWLGEDRAIAVFADHADVRRQSAALKKLLRSWIAAL